MHQAYFCTWRYEASEGTDADAAPAVALERPNTHAVVAGFTHRAPVAGLAHLGIVDEALVALHLSRPAMPNKVRRKSAYSAALVNTLRRRWRATGLLRCYDFRQH